MAKAGYIMGGARGKVGDYVFQKGEKGTIQRVKVTPANPKTLAQRKQRMSFAMANSAAAAMRFIVNHSFENISGEKNNIREFVRLNSKLLRAEIDSLVAGSGTFNGSAEIKGARGAQPADYIISRGSAFYPQFEAKADYDNGVLIVPAGQLADLNATITSQELYEKALAVIGLKPGDQISIICMMTTENVIASFEGETNKLCKVIANRVTFKATLPEGFNGKLYDGVSYVINAELIDETEGEGKMSIMETTLEEGGDTYLVLFLKDIPNGDYLKGEAVGVVRSVKNLNGKYEYSPCQLKFIGDANNAITVLGSYADSAKAGDSDYFLDQAE